MQKTKNPLDSKLLTNVIKSKLFTDNYHCAENLLASERLLKQYLFNNIKFLLFQDFFFFFYFRYYDSSDLRSSAFSKWDDNTDSFWKKENNSRDVDVMLTSKSTGFSDRYTKKT